jgi:hypothetical protein
MGIKKSPGQTRPGGGGPGWVPYPVGPYARPYFFSFFQAPAWARLFLPRAGHGTGPGSATRQKLQPLLLRAHA